MLPRLLKKVLGFPFRIVRRALQLWTPSQPEILPVGGLTPEASSELLFALRQAAITAEVRRCDARPYEMVFIGMFRAFLPWYHSARHALLWSPCRMNALSVTG